jgi:hypothetical protein
LDEKVVTLCLGRLYPRLSPLQYLKDEQFVLSVGVKEAQKSKSAIPWTILDYLSVIVKQRNLSIRTEEQSTKKNPNAGKVIVPATKHVCEALGITASKNNDLFTLLNGLGDNSPAVQFLLGLESVSNLSPFQIISFEPYF